MSGLTQEQWCSFLTRKRYFLVFEIKMSFPMETEKLKIVAENNLTPICTGTGKSTLVSKICNVHDSAGLFLDCKSLKLGWISLSLYTKMIDSHSLTLLWLCHAISNMISCSYASVVFYDSHLCCSTLITLQEGGGGGVIRAVGVSYGGI